MLRAASLHPRLRRLLTLLCRLLTGEKGGHQAGEAFEFPPERTVLFEYELGLPSRFEQTLVNFLLPLKVGPHEALDCRHQAPTEHGEDRAAIAGRRSTETIADAAEHAGPRTHLGAGNRGVRPLLRQDRRAARDLRVARLGRLLGPYFRRDVVSCGHRLGGSDETRRWSASISRSLRRIVSPAAWGDRSTNNRFRAVTRVLGRLGVGHHGPHVGRRLIEVRFGPPGGGWIGIAARRDRYERVVNEITVSRPHERHVPRIRRGDDRLSQGDGFCQSEPEALRAVQ